MNKLIISLKWLGYWSKKILPNFIPRFFAKMASAFITPIHFSLQSGHFRSSWLKRSVSNQNKPIPWYTYPLIDFLEQRDFSNKTVLEIGGGQSSFWWAKKAKQVTTFEGNQQWFEFIKKQNTFDNLQIEFIDAENQDLLIALEEKIASTSNTTFDIIIIDGMDRYRLINHFIPLLSDKGIIIIDDSERYDFTTTFEEHGFSKIDFYGYAPGVIFPKCSSIQFKEINEYLSNKIPVKAAVQK